MSILFRTFIELHFSTTITIVSLSKKISSPQNRVYLKTSLSGKPVGNLHNSNGCFGPLRESILLREFWKNFCNAKMVAELCDPIVCQGVVISLLEALIQPQNKQS